MPMVQVRPAASAGFKMGSLHQLLLTALSLGLDSFMAGLAIGPILPSWGGRMLSALAFGLCDGLASWLGASIQHQLPDLPEFVLYIGSVVLLLAGAIRSRAWLFALPLVLSIDNLAAAVPAGQAPVLALGSAAMAGVGLALGGVGRMMALAVMRHRVPA
jgi:putative Mn2+ efflux pump MntP